MSSHLYKRPLMFFCVFFLITFYIGFSLSSAVTYFILSLSSLAAFVILLFHFRNMHGRFFTRYLSAALGITLGALFCISYSHSVIKKDKSVNGKEYSCEAVVEETVYESEYLTTYNVKIISLNGKSCQIKSRIKITSGVYADTNDIISFTGTFYVPQEKTLTYDEKEYCFSNGIFICAQASDAEIIGHDTSFMSNIRSVRSKLKSMLTVTLGNENGGFCAGLLLGIRDAVPQKLETSFSYLGVTHILSVSGLHLTIILSCVFALCTRLYFGRKLKFCVCAAAILLFALLAGCGPAVMRSGMMAFLAYLAFVCGRKQDPLTSLFFSALVTVIIFPYYIRSISYILSVSASLGIIVFGIPSCSLISKKIPSSKPFPSLIKTVLMSCAICLSATLSTLPAVWYHFGIISPNALLSNLIFVPICTLILILSILLLIFCYTPQIKVISVPISFLCNLTDDLSYVMSRSLPEPESLLYPFAFVCAFICISLYVLLVLFKKGRVLILIAITLTFILSYSLGYYIRFNSNDSATEIICVNDGENDYILVSSSNKTLLIDVSAGAYSSMSESSGYSSIFYDCSPDAILITHVHRKHIETISRLSDSTRIKQIIIPSPRNEQEEIYVTAIKRSAETRDISIIEFDADITSYLTFGSCKITMYRQSYLKRSSQPLITFKIENMRSFVYLGSSACEGFDSEELADILTGAEYLFLGTHGPNIKNPLKLPFEINHTFVSNTDINEDYGCNFEVIGAYKKIKLK